MSRNLVNNATSDDQQLPGGYVLKQLSDRTLASSGDCSDIEGYLRNRLTKSSPDVRFKALMCIKYIAMNGADAFRLNFQRDNNVIRDCMHFRGPPDPLRGETPYQKVRDAAKETMGAVFTQPQPRQVTASNRIQGMGSSSSSSPPQSSSSSPPHDTHGYSSGVYNAPVPKLESGAYSSGKMQGFGNPAFNNTNQPSMIDKFKDRFRPNNASGGGGGPSEYRPYQSPGAYAGPQHTQEAPAPAHANVSAPRQRGQVGGGWGAAAAHNAASRSSASSSSSSSSLRRDPPAPRSTPPPSANIGNGTSTRSVRQAKASTGEFESRMVDAITQPSGVRTAPSAAELRDFVDKARNVDGVLLASILQAKLGAADWRAQLKALCVIDKLIEEGFTDVSEYFCHELGELVGFEGSSIKQIASKANTILIRLHIKEPEAQQPSASPAKQVLPDLMTMDDDNNDDEKQQQQQPSSSSSSSNIFADLSVKTKPPSTSAPVPVNKGTHDPLASLFDAPPASAPATVHPSHAVGGGGGGDDDAFGLFNQSEVTPSHPVSAPASVRNDDDGGDAFGLFSSNSNSGGGGGGGGDVDPLAMLLNNTTIQPHHQHSPPKQHHHHHQPHHHHHQQQQQQAQYNQFANMPLTMDPPTGSANRFGYGNGQGASPASNGMMDFTVKPAPQNAPQATSLRQANIFDDLTGTKAMSPKKKKEEGFNFVHDDSFSFVQDELKQV